MIVMDDKPNVLPSTTLEFSNETYRLRSDNYRTLARNFIEEHLTYGDRAALVTISGRKDMAQEFTNNRERLLSAVNKFELGYGQETVANDFNLVPTIRTTGPGARGGGGMTGTADTLRSEGGGAQRLDTARSAMFGLQALAKYLAQIPARRKAIVFFSERMTDSNLTTSNFNLALDSDEALDFRNLLEATARANVSIYIVDPIGSPFGRGARGNFVDDAASGNLRDSSVFDNLRRDGLMSLAESTGGFAVTASNEFAAGFERIVEENSSYYLLGYNTSNTKIDGKFRRIRVTVDRPGLTVRTRSGYFGREAKPEEKRTIKELSTGLNEVLQSPLPVPGLTMSVSAATYRGTGSDASVSVIVEARGSDLGFMSDAARYNGLIDVVMIATDADGKIKASERGALRMNLSRDTHQLISGNSVRLLTRLKLKPGRYQLRVGAEDRMKGRTPGSVLYDLDVPDFTKGEMALSSVAIASAIASRIPTTGTDNHWQQVLHTLPTTQREFSSRDELRQYVEVYISDKKVEEIDVTATVRSDAGTRVFFNRQTIRVQRGSDKTATQPVLTAIPLKDFKPGQYVLTVEARGTGQEQWPAERNIPFTVSD
jgi:VWFA-related protein